MGLKELLKSDRQQSPKKTIVVVDDELSQRNALQNLLSGIGYNVLVYANAKTAQKGIEETYEEGLTIDLVILDEWMSPTRGHELAPKIEDMHERLGKPQVPIVFYTAYAQKKELCLACNPAAIVYKGGDEMPGASYDRLIQTIKEII